MLRTSAFSLITGTCIALLWLSTQARLPLPPVDLEVHDSLNGRGLFLKYCFSCHDLEIERIGPALLHVTRRRKQGWLVKFIQNGPALVKKGDKTAVSLYLKYNYVNHPEFTSLTKKEINLIIEYLKSSSDSVVIPLRERGIKL